MIKENVIIRLTLDRFFFSVADSDFCTTVVFNCNIKHALHAAFNNLTEHTKKKV